MTNGMKQGAAIVVTAIIAAIALKQLTPAPTDSQHVAISLWPQGEPSAATRCTRCTALGSPAALALFGLGAQSDGGPPTASQYALARICGIPGDGGAALDLPAGYDTILDSCTADEPYDGGPQLEVWLQGSATAPWACACAKDSTCLQVSDGGAALPHVTLAAGTWIGAGCVAKACIEFAGRSSWPPQCP